MIEVDGLSHRYGSGEPVLRDISFSVASREKVVLLGGNGSGKSTLLKILNGLIDSCQGSYRYKGRAVSRESLKDKAFNRQFRREVVLLFQHPDTMIFNPTVYDEIAFSVRQLGVNDLDERIRHWATVVGVADYLQRTPFSLSGGEKQKVCLAALLALEPEVLLLDEPAANLDPRSVGWLVDFLQDLELTTVVTTHNLSLAAELGKRTVVLSERHELIYDGALSSFLADRDRLIEANLVHRHRHRHGGLEHQHYHVHDWE